MSRYKYTEDNPLKVFTAFSGYDSQCLALDRIGIPYELVGWSDRQIAKEMGFNRSTICHGRLSAESSLKYIKGYKERYQGIQGEISRVRTEMRTLLKIKHYETI